MKYYVEKEIKNGKNTVHTEPCSKRSKSGTVLVGDFKASKPALLAAKKIKTKSSPCSTCCN